MTHATQAHRAVTLSQFQKSMYRRTGKDTCRWCGAELHVGDRVVVKFNGRCWRLYHAACYRHKVIEL